MKSRVFIAAVAVMVVAALYLAAHYHGRGSAAGIGEPPFAADFSLPDLDGHTLTLSSYRGKVVLLDFWATWCDPCREQIPHFVELQNKYRGQGLQIIGVSMDDGPEPVREFNQRFRMNYPVVMGNAKTGESYGGVLGLPIAFLIGRDGRVYSRHIGATPTPVFENDIVKLLHTGTTSSVLRPGSTGRVGGGGLKLGQRPRADCDRVLAVLIRLGGWRCMLASLATRTRGAFRLFFLLGMMYYLWPDAGLVWLPTHTHWAGNGK